MRQLVTLATVLTLFSCARAVAPLPPLDASTANALPSAPTATTAPRGRIEIREALAAGPIAAYVRQEDERARQDGRRLVVYVGATWCEPCRRFLDAARAGELDGEFGHLRLLEFDLDRDREALAAAGYRSELIPLIALPGADGRGNGRGMQGSVKGEGAVANMRPRLRELLALP